MIWRALLAGAVLALTAGAAGAQCVTIDPASLPVPYNPFNASSGINQVVTLKATNFTGEFDVNVETTPENGGSVRQSFRWNVGTDSMATTNVTVSIPGNNPTRITAWAEVLF